MAPKGKADLPRQHNLRTGGPLAGRNAGVSLTAPSTVRNSVAAKLGDIAAEAGLARLHIVAWRDLDDPEAGGSEVHAARVSSLWAEAGLDVTMHTSAAVGHPSRATRDGYQLVRTSGRYGVFPQTALRGITRASRHRPDGVVEIWNGMPFLSPLWARGPRVVFLHHVHAEMWRMVLPGRLARVGEVMERSLAPPFYRSTPIVTLSESSKRNIVDVMRMPPGHVTVVPPGIDERFAPGGRRSPRPLVAAVGRLVPYKRFDLLIAALVRLRRHHPDLEAVIAGEGYERPLLEAAITAHDAGSWLRLPGRLTDDEVVALYRRAWVVASTSSHEGWGMTITEAAACGTPAVATKISGHLDAIVDRRTGWLVTGPDELDFALNTLLSDARLRSRLGVEARQRAEALTWEATARGTLQVLADDAVRRRSLKL